jgi:hypothetical protein
MSCGSTMVVHSTADPEFKGSNLPAKGTVKLEKKKDDE